MYVKIITCTLKKNCVRTRRQHKPNTKCKRYSQVTSDRTGLPLIDTKTEGYNTETG